MATAQQCSSIMRLFVFVALAFGFVGFLGSRGSATTASSALSSQLQVSFK